MKGKVVCSLAILMFSLVTVKLSASLSTGNFATDFSVTDINGINYNLSEMLAEGKHVIVNFGAAWSPSSWNYAVSETLNDINAIYGKEGLNNLVVLYIESDVNTSIECIKGSESCNSSSMGNWSSLLNHAIINITAEEAELLSLYQVDQYPTIYGIDTNWKITNLGQANHAKITEWIMGESGLQAGNNFIPNDFSNDVSYSSNKYEVLNDTGTVGLSNFSEKRAHRGSAMLNFLNDTYSEVLAEAANQQIQLAESVVYNDIDFSSYGSFGGAD